MQGTQGNTWHQAPSVGIGHPDLINWQVCLWLRGAVLAPGEHRQGISPMHSFSASRCWQRGQFSSPHSFFCLHKYNAKHV